MSVERMLGRLAWRLARHAPPHIDRDDLMQEARLALHVSARPGAHAGYVRTRARGAMVDALRAAGTPPGLVLPLPDDWDAAAPERDGPEHILMRRQRAEHALRRLELNPRWWRVAGGVLSGRQLIDIAADLGVSHSRVSQMLRAMVAAVDDRSTTLARM